METLSIKKQQKFYSLPKRHKQIRCFEQRPFVRTKALRLEQRPDEGRPLETSNLFGGRLLPQNGSNSDYFAFLTPGKLSYASEICIPSTLILVWRITGLGNSVTLVKIWTKVYHIRDIYTQNGKA